MQNKHTRYLLGSILVGALVLSACGSDSDTSSSNDDATNDTATTAAGDGTASYDEIEEVRRIGRGLLLSHQHFISAKLEVPDSRRDT